LTIYKLLTPWQHGEDLDDAVFRIAATFPLRELRSKRYMIPGDECFGFDPNAAVARKKLDGQPGGGNKIRPQPAHKIHLEVNSR
jgi:hypothetical protein